MEALRDLLIGVVVIITFIVVMMSIFALIEPWMRELNCYAHKLHGSTTYECPQTEK